MESHHRAVQAIYYPGFTLGGLIGEFGSILGLAALLHVIPEHNAAFWWAGGALSKATELGA